MKSVYKNNSIIRAAAVISLCFLLTSTGWLSWEYHLLEQIPSGISDICTMVVGYLLQALGIGLYAVILKGKKAYAKKAFPAALILHMLFMFPAVLSPYAAGTLIFGFFMNIACGIIAGYYLFVLTVRVPGEHKAAAFGCGYGVSILASWLLSRIGGGSFYYSEAVLVICFFLTAAAYFAACERKIMSGENESGAAAASAGEEKRGAQAAAGTAGGNMLRRQSLLISAFILVFLFSVVNSSGFSFPTADLGQGVNIELSRLVYAAGLMIAGFVTDRNRRYGAVCALTALIIPFIILSLRGESVSAVFFWALSYFAFGFYSVYRIILFSDIAKEQDLLPVSGFGLLAGRIGDAAGEAVCILLGSHLPVMILVTAVLFAAAVAVFFRLYRLLYIPESAGEQTEKERFAVFSAAHDLSTREQDMLRLLLERKTNAEMAEDLFISENTVKFHIRNLLQKTGCRNRNELLTTYNAYFARKTG